MTVLSHESQGISGNLDVLGGLFPIFVPVVVIFVVWLIISDCDRLAVLLSALCAIGRTLRPVGRALRWLFDRFNLGMAWACACAAVLLSFLLLLNAFYGRPVSLFDGYVFFTGCVMSWGFERLYRSDLNAAKQRGDE